MHKLPLILLVLCGFTTIAQKKTLKAIDNAITIPGVEGHLRFLAADEMRGRNTGSPELDIAANYIMSTFMRAGVQPADGKSFFQDVSLMRTTPPLKIALEIEANGTRGTVDVVHVAGNGGAFTKAMVFLGYGTAEDFDKVDVKDKIAVCLFGAQGSTSMADALFNSGPAKRSLATEKGAVALVEVMSFPGVPWGSLVNYFSRSRTSLLETKTGVPHVLTRQSEGGPVPSLIEKHTGNGMLTIEIAAPVPVPAKNVVGIIRGTDEKLRGEFVAISAHYDHVGVNKQAGQDSIFNGARDNAIGTTALLEAAQFFAAHPPKRSLLLIALTAEEVGLLGSAWYAEHPVIPLKQTVFNLNCDGAGYNDTSIASVIDFNRTSADDLLRQACAAAGLGLKGDPAPEQGLYDRSDNVSFAKKGVPAVNLSPGVKAFDQDLMKFYHKPADEVESLDMNYLVKFYRAMLHSVHLLGNAANAPQWKAGDKYEAAGKALYAK